jgi:ADP-ribose pyrophosphatase YjhB (NUDIX family)
VLQELFAGVGEKQGRAIGSIPGPAPVARQNHLTGVVLFHHLSYRTSSEHHQTKKPMIITVRVYGILINEKKQVLVSDEYIRGGLFTKFPGGGLDFGEGTRDCLKREFKEEMNLSVAIGDHIYTTDYFQPSAFREGQQILSIYYYVKALEPITAPLRTQPFDFDEEQLKIYEEKKEIESFRFIDWENFNEECVTLPIDKIVVRMLKKDDSNKY